MIEIKVSPDKDFRLDEEGSRSRDRLVSQIDSAIDFLTRIRNNLSLDLSSRHLKESSRFVIGDYKNEN